MKLSVREFDAMQMGWRKWSIEKVEPKPLGAMYCHADVINYGNLPYTDFIRTETLCQGGKLCNFHFVRHETDAGEGWERSRSI